MSVAEKYISTPAKRKDAKFDKRKSIKKTIVFLIFPFFAICFLIFAFYLSGVSEINQYYANKYLQNIEFLKNDVQEILEEKSGRDELNGKLFPLLAQYNIYALNINYGDDKISVGEINNELNKNSYELQVSSDDPSNSEKVLVEIYLMPVKAYLYRKNIILFTVLILVAVASIFVVYCYANILFKQSVTPIINTAARLKEGQYNARFNEDSNDLMAKVAFILNKAFERVLSDKKKLEKINQHLINEERALCLSKESAETALHAYGDSVITLNSNGVIEYINSDAEAILGYEPNSLAGTPFSEKVKIVGLNGEQQNLLLDLINNQGDDGQKIGFLIRADERQIEISYAASFIRDHNDELIGYIVILEDISPKRRVGKKLQFKAFYDDLTCLYNSRSLDIYLETFIHDAKETNSDHALLVIDINEYANVCNNFGQVYGDELLTKIAKNIENRTRDTDILCRLKTDKLGLLITYCSVDKAKNIAENISLELRKQTFSLQDREFNVSVNIGICIIDKESISRDEVIASAEFASRKAEEHECEVYVYEHDLKEIESQRDEYKWVKKLTRAMQNDLFVLVAQPIYSLSDNESTISHYELLIRFAGDNNEEYLLPHEFIAVAEAYFLMPAIDRWVINKSFQAINSFPLPTRININLSGQSLSDHGFVEYVTNQIKTENVNPQSVCFEITETAAISNLDNAKNVIDQLRKVGCRFALDDFGSGVSSFRYLQNLNVDYIKIDGSFISDVNHNLFNQVFVKSICDVARVLNIKTIAEYVDKQEVVTFLEEIGVNYAQGNYLGEPILLSDINVLPEDEVRRKTSC